MSSSTTDQVRGLHDLLYDAVQGGTAQAEATYRAIARGPFGVLRRAGCLAPPARLVELAHDGVVTITFGSIREITGLARAATTRILPRATEVAQGRARSQEGDALL